MIRDILTLMAGIFVVIAIMLALQGELPVGIGVKVGIMVVLVIFIWLPLKILHKWSFIKNGDRELFKYAFGRRLYKVLVGQKEYDEMERYLEKKR